MEFCFVLNVSPRMLDLLYWIEMKSPRFLYDVWWISSRSLYLFFVSFFMLFDLSFLVLHHFSMDTIEIEKNLIGDGVFLSNFLIFSILFPKHEELQYTFLRYYTRLSMTWNLSCVNTMSYNGFLNVIVATLFYFVNGIQNICNGFLLMVFHCLFFYSMRLGVITVLKEKFH